MKNFLKLTGSISALMFFILSPDLRAQSVAMVPADAWISKFNSSVGQTTNSFSQATSFNFLKGQVVSDQVNFSGRFTVLNLKPDSQLGLFNMDVSLNSAQAVAKNLQIHVVTEQDLGFGSATVTLNAVCSSLTVSVASTQGVSVQVDKNFQVLHLTTNFETLNLDTKLEGCDSSIAGLQQEVQARILAILRAQLFDTQLRQILTDQISQQLSTNIKNVANYFVESKSSDVKVSLSIDAQNKLWMYVGEAALTAFSASEIAELSKSDKPAALFKKAELEKTLLVNLNAQIAKAPILSVGNEALEKLTCSRWTQFFVWPALKAFQKCFQMQFVSEIKELKLTDVTKLRFSINSYSWAQAKEPLRNIATFNLQTDVGLNPSAVKINSIVGQNDPEFLKWSGRSKRISTGLVTSTLQAYLQEQIALLVKGNDMLNPANIKNIKLITPETLFVQLK
ncbi:MAG: hypothetical protein H7256_05675 [Bdellovibrio sp.]|nr:hypothetical protein [Bdellovibrio sp.]